MPTRAQIKKRAKEMFAFHLRRLIDEQQLTQTALADHLRMKQSAISRLLNEKKDVQFSTIHTMAIGLGVDLCEFCKEIPKKVR